MVGKIIMAMTVNDFFALAVWFNESDHKIIRRGLEGKGTLVFFKSAGRVYAVNNLLPAEELVVIWSDGLITPVREFFVWAKKVQKARKLRDRLTGANYFEERFGPSWYHIFFGPKSFAWNHGSGARGFPFSPAWGKTPIFKPLDLINMRDRQPQSKDIFQRLLKLDCIQLSDGNISFLADPITVEDDGRILVELWHKGNLDRSVRLSVADLEEWSNNLIETNFEIVGEA